MEYNKEYKQIEKLLEDYIMHDLGIVSFYVSIKDTLPVKYREYPPLIRIGLRSKKTDNKKNQELVKKWFSDTLSLDKPYLERDYGNTDKEVLYEITYKLSVELYNKLLILSKMKQ